MAGDAQVDQEYVHNPGLRVPISLDFLHLYIHRSYTFA